MTKKEKKNHFLLRRTLLASALAAGFSLLLPCPGHAADWKPARPINLIVPWSAGGSTDQVTRVVAAEMEKALGQTIVIINQPGASGSIGTMSALEAARDGYTWAAGAAQDLGAYETMGSLKTRLSDWNLFLSVANVSVLSVNAKAPYKDAKELLDAMKAQPGNRRRHLLRPYGDGADRQGRRCQISPCHL
jgi:tripartite-type tricarboxylate transporter receptor subunit TctC